MEEETELVESESTEEKTEEKISWVMAGNSDREFGDSRDKAGQLVLCQSGVSEEGVSGRKRRACVGKRVVESQPGGHRVFSAADVVFALQLQRRDTKAISHHTHALHLPQERIHHHFVCPARTSFCTNFFSPW